MEFPTFPSVVYYNIISNFLGMGTNYSLPHTPEGYLSSMEDNIDVSSDSHALDTPDISAISDNIDSTDDLVPSITSNCIYADFPFPSL